jgi:hypothetical protein
LGLDLIGGGTKLTFADGADAAQALELAAAGGASQAAEAMDVGIADESGGGLGADAGDGEQVADGAGQRVEQVVVELHATLCDELADLAA